MKCVLPPELDDSQLLGFLDGVNAGDTAAHLDKCQYCRERAEALALLQNGLTSRLYRISCPPSSELGEYHLRMLPASRVLVIASHLSECPHCTRELADLKEFMSIPLMAPAGVLQQVKVLIAKLVGGNLGAGMDSMPSLVALRGQSKGPLTLEADGLVIVLDVQPESTGGLAILGQVAADDQDYWTEALVELQHGSRAKFSTRLDDLGGFRYEGVELGPQELRLISRDGAVMVVSSFSLSD